MSDVFRQQYRELTDENLASLTDIKSTAEELHKIFEDLGASRELSLAKTKLEEAVMWAVKHVTK